MTVSARIQTGTHCAQPKLPDGEVLIFAGDATLYGSFAELQAPSSMAALTIRRTQCDCS
jgi:hypothetical protein